MPSFSCNCTKFHIFLMQSTHASFMYISQKSHTCSLVDLTFLFLHSNIQARYNHSRDRKQRRRASYFCATTKLDSVHYMLRIRDKEKQVLISQK